jgi:hypothetical protein
MSRVVSTIESDLAAIRALTPTVDVERGAARFAAATVSLGAVASGALAPAQLQSGAVTLKSLSFAPSLLAKLLGFTVLSSLAIGIGPLPSSEDARSPLVLCERPTALSATSLSGAAPIPRMQAKPNLPQPSAAPAPAAAAPSAPVASLRAVSPQAQVSVKPPRKSQLAAEVELLANARAQLAVDPSATLRALQSEGAAPSKRLQEERDILTIRALLGAGRREEARAAAGRFLSRYPASPFTKTARSIAD